MSRPPQVPSSSVARSPTQPSTRVSGTQPTNAIPSAIPTTVPPKTSALNTSPPVRVNAAEKVATAEKVLLPVVQRMINQLDSLFVEFVGPVGMELAEDVYKLWVKTGKTSPSGLRQYAYALSVQLDNPAERRQFTEHADHLLLQLQSGYVR